MIDSIGRKRPPLPVRAYRSFRSMGLAQYMGLLWSYVHEYIAFWFGKDPVIFLSGCPGGSKQYRCLNQAEMLRRRGIGASVLTYSSRVCRHLPGHYRVFIFQRVFMDREALSALSEIRRHGGIIIFETDDLVYDGKFVEHMAIYRSFEDEERQRYAHGIGKELLTDPAVEVCTVSTPFLERAIRADYPGKRVFVLRNKLGECQIAAAERALQAQRRLRPSDGMVRIGYFSGSKSHDRDFESVSGVLLDVLRNHPNVALVIVGYLTLDGRFKEFGGRIEGFPFVSPGKLPRLIMRCDLNIAPLEVENPFCQAKSELKFFEAGILGIPTVASATESFREAIRHGENGLLAATPLEWEEGLERLIAEPNLRARLGQQARSDTLACHTTSRDDPAVTAFVDFLQTKIASDGEVARQSSVSGSRRQDRTMTPDE